jgi:ABC-type Na+ efflux pump permease subunit
MRKIIATANREFKATALTKGFIFGTFVLPVLIWAVLGAAFALGLFDMDKPPIKGTIAVVDTTPDGFFVGGLEGYFDKARQEAIRQEQVAQGKEAMEQAAESMPGAGAAAGRVDLESFVRKAPEVTIENAGPDASIDSLKSRVTSGDLLAVIIASPETLLPPREFGPDATPEERKAAKENRYELYLSPSVESDIADNIRDGVETIVIDHRFEMAGMDLTATRRIMSKPKTEVQRFNEAGEAKKTNEALEKMIPLAPVVFLLMAILTGASYLLMSTVEEKNSRVMEVLLSGISPMQLMTGKVLGQGLVGLVILAVYGGTGVAAAIVFASNYELPISLVWFSIAYFFIGYFIFAGIFAAIGSAVNEIREAQALQGPVMGAIILLVYLSIFAGMNDTNSTMSRVMSLIPISSPFAMPMRIANAQAPPAMWEVLVSLALGLAGVVFFIWASAKIFRIGVLAYGQPPTLKGLIGWVRQG